MIKDESYFKQVNRRLAGARFLLLSAEEPSLKVNPVGRQALLDSALLQFYFASFSYLNELLEYYRRPVIDIASTDLSSVLLEPTKYFDGVHEFVALQKWSQDNDGFLVKLATLPSSFIALATNEKHESPQDVQLESENDTLLAKQVDLIAVSENVESLDLNNLADAQSIQAILASFQSLIDSHRENQLEY